MKNDPPGLYLVLAGFCVIGAGMLALLVTVVDRISVVYFQAKIGSPAFCLVMLGFGMTFMGLIEGALADHWRKKR